MDFNSIRQVVRSYLSEITKDSGSTEVWVACSKAAHAFAFADPGTMALVYAACYQTLELRGKQMPERIDYVFFHKLAGEWYGKVPEDEGAGVREGSSQIPYGDHRRRVREEPVRDEGRSEWGRSAQGLQQTREERTFGIRGRGQEAGEDES